MVNTVECRGNKKVKILFCIYALTGGGAEKVLTDIVRHLDRKKYDITVLSLLNEGIYVEDVKKSCSYRYVVPMLRPIILAKLIKKLLLLVAKFLPPRILYKLCVREKYDVEVAFLEGIATKVISGSANCNSKKYAWVHTDMGLHPYSTKYYRNIGQEKKAYAVFDKILCVSMAAKMSFIKKYDYGESTVQVQLNLFDEKDILLKSKQPSPVPIKPKTIIAVGRLSQEKGFLRLVSVMSRLNNDGFKYSLIIVGDGKERESVEREIDNNSLKDVVKVTGFLTNPYPLIAQADLLVSSSYAEGYSNVVAEAIILGTPVVATASGGVTEILGNSRYGLITQNTENGLYEGLKCVLKDDASLSRLKLKALERQNFYRLSNRLRELDGLFLASTRRKVNDKHKVSR